MAVTTIFNVEQSAEDPILHLMNAYASDTHENKIDVSIGVYKTEEGDPNFVFPSVKAAKARLAENDPGHCYTSMSGIPAFVKQAQRTVFGEDCKNVASVQAISGSGALHLALELLVELGLKDFHVGTPCWGNYQGMIEHSGGNYHTHNYYDAVAHSVDFESILAALNAAPSKSVFILQAVCHNPTGLDLSHDQWLEVFKVVKKRNLVPLFDIAYQGFCTGNVDEDAWAVREAWRQGLEFVVGQSYSKNMGLYAERVGCTHVCTKNEAAVVPIKSALTRLVRSEFSFAPAFGARVSTLLQEDEELRKSWAQDVSDVTFRLKDMRQKVFQKLNELGTPGSWEHVISSQGLFWFSGLTPNQTQKLQDEYHVYGILNGRVNIAGLNNSNIDKYCAALDAVVRKYPE